MIQVGDRIKKVETSEIAYCYIRMKDVYIRTFQGNAYPLDYSLNQLEEMLDPATFFRINRQYIVNIESIVQMTALSRSRVKLKLNPAAEDGADTIVSIDRAGPFKEWLDS